MATLIRKMKNYPALEGVGTEREIELVCTRRQRGRNYSRLSQRQVRLGKTRNRNRRQGMKSRYKRINNAGRIDKQVRLD